MKYEQIEQAARDLCTTDRQEQWLQDFGMACFADGARRRIEAAWHEASECPERYEQIILSRGNGFSMVRLIDDTRGWELYTRTEDVARWAYVRDLLPERKEETK